MTNIPRGVLVCAKTLSGAEVAVSVEKIEARHWIARNPSA
jgi:hypothetical protein